MFQIMPDYINKCPSQWADITNFHSYKGNTLCKMKTLIEKIQFIVQDIFKIVIGYIQSESEILLAYFNS